eukprot:gene16039-18100_t
MSDIIHEITAKPKWMEKLKDEAITNRWRIELQKHCLNDQIIDTTFRLLQRSRSHILDHTKFQEESDYDWHLLVGVSPQDIWPTEMCSCECLICAGEESLPYQLQEYHENDENYRNIQNSLKKYKKIKYDIGRIKQIPQAGEAGIKESLNSCESSPTSSEQRIDSK